MPKKDRIQTTWSKASSICGLKARTGGRDAGHWGHPLFMKPAKRNRFPVGNTNKKGKENHN
jgi:hypothetical protein